MLTILSQSSKVTSKLKQHHVDVLNVFGNIVPNKVIKIRDRMPQG